MNGEPTHESPTVGNTAAFDIRLKSQLFLLFNLFLLLFMSLITLFDIIHIFYYILLYYFNYLLVLFIIISLKKFNFY